MAKEYVWQLTIDGEDHRVECILAGNKYTLYVNDAFLTNVYRKTFRLDDLELPVMICGKECLFIVWDAKPDLVMDGILLSRGVDYQQAMTKRNKDHQMVHRLVFWFGVTILVLVAVFAVIGVMNGQVYDDMLFYTVGGWFMVIYGHDKTRWLTHPKNSPIITEENNEGADLE